MPRNKSSAHRPGGKKVGATGKSPASTQPKGKRGKSRSYAPPSARDQASKLLDIAGRLLNRKLKLAQDTETRKAVTMARGAEQIHVIDDQIARHTADAEKFYTENRHELVPRPTQKSIRLPNGQMGYKRPTARFVLPSDEELAKGLETLNQLGIPDLKNSGLRNLVTKTKRTGYNYVVDRQALRKFLHSSPHAAAIATHCGIEIVPGKDEFFINPHRGREAQEFARNPKAPISKPKK